jgi:predicted small metal-binding protein
MTHMLSLSCSDLHPGCGAVLEGSTPDELVLYYVLHGSGVGHRADVELDELLGSIGIAPAPTRPVAAAH